MSLDLLRMDLPEWSWSCIKHGMMWQYEGRGGARTVTINIYGLLMGPLAEESPTYWIVRETGGTFLTWYNRERDRLENEAAVVAPP